MNSHIPKYCIILVHFGAPAATDRALSALFSSTQTPTKTVIIDHAHQPYSTALSYPLTIIRPTKNMGYAAGVNVGLGFLVSKNLAKHDLVIAMNNDAVVSPTTLSQLQFPSVPTLVGCRGGHLNYLTGRTALDKKPVNYLDGAFLAATWATWTKLKGMPDEYFLYWEDVALSRRAWKRSISLVVQPELNVQHQPLHPSLTTDQRLYYLVKNGARFLEQDAPGIWPIFWRSKNRLRYLYHRWLSTRPEAPLIARALYDAIHR